MKRNKSVRGFTLIEMLVVIAIISVLAAVLFPVFGQVRERARATVCLSNMRQLGTALYSYAQDYDEHWPLDAHTTNEDTWVFNLDPYVGRDRRLYRCPDDNSSNWYPPPPGRVATNVRFTSYGTNMWMAPFLGPGDTADTHGYSTLASIRSPASTIYCAEMVENTTDDHFHAAWWRPNPEYTYEPAGTGLAAKRHGDAANYFFCDGHAKRLRFAQTWTKDGTIDLYDPRR